LEKGCGGGNGSSGEDALHVGGGSAVLYVCTGLLNFLVEFSDTKEGEILMGDKDDAFACNNGDIRVVVVIGFHRIENTGTKVIVFILESGWCNEYRDASGQDRKDQKHGIRIIAVKSLAFSKYITDLIIRGTIKWMGVFRVKK